MSIDYLNQNCWGVCGFVAAIQAACYNGQQNRVETLAGVSIDDAKFDKVSTSYNILYPVIHKFFAQASDDLKKELQSFAGHLNVTYDNSVDNMIKKMGIDTDMVDLTIGIAMNGKAMNELCKYLHLRQHDFHGTTESTLKPTFDYKNTIYGIRFGERIDGRLGFYAGLQHWVYMDQKNNIYTWGNLMSDDVKSCIKEITHYLPL